MLPVLRLQAPPPSPRLLRSADILSEVDEVEFVQSDFLHGEEQPVKGQGQVHGLTLQTEGAGLNPTPAASGGARLRLKRLNQTNAASVH